MKKISLLAIIGAVFILMSCATTVDYAVTRPAELDMNGANTISVLPFRPSRRTNIHVNAPRRGEKIIISDYFYSYMDMKGEESRVIRHINSELESGLAKSKYLHLVDSDEVQEALRRGTASRIVDVYLAGEILNFDIDDEKIYSKKVVNSNDGKKSASSGKTVIGGGETSDGKQIISEETKEVITEVKFKRNVYLYYVYEIIDAATDEIISYQEVEIQKSSGECNNPRNLPDAFDIIKYDLDSNLKKIIKSVQPYSITRTLSLMSNKENKDAFKVGDNLVEVGNISGAYDYYYKLYEKQGIFEAGYNAAILLEALGKLDEAEKLMTELCLNAETDKQARKSRFALEDIKYEIKQNKKLKGQLENQSERAEEK